MTTADPVEKSRLRAQWNELYQSGAFRETRPYGCGIRQRAQCPSGTRVGALHHIIPPGKLRPYLIDAVERGMRKAYATAQAVCTTAGAG